MGIQGLLRGMPMEDGNVADFKGQNLAIDASSWLFKAGYSCAERLVESIESGKQDPICEGIYCRYMVSRCRELLSGDNKIYLVFDGQRCPLKADTNAEREQKRQVHLNEARRLKAIGQNSQAQDKYKACLGKGTDTMARIVSSYLQKNKQEQVECVFSPYEADAQLVRLVVDGHAHAVVTEDSDVLVYSATCGLSFPIIYKLDRRRGTCRILRMDWLLSSSFPEKKEQKVSDAFWSVIRSFAKAEQKCEGTGVRLFVQACVLSGCDYVANKMAGVGLINAFSLVHQHAHIPPDKRFRTILQNKLIPNLVPYEQLLSQSEVVFYHHTVYQISSSRQHHSTNGKDLVVSSFFSPRNTNSSRKKQEPKRNRQLVPLNLPTSSSPNLKRFDSSSGLDILGKGTSEILLSRSLDLHPTLDETDEKDDNPLSSTQNSSSSIDEPMFNNGGCGGGKISSLLENNPLSQFAFPGSAIIKNKTQSFKKNKQKSNCPNDDDNNGNGQSLNGTNEKNNSIEKPSSSTIMNNCSERFTPKSQRKKNTSRQVTLDDESKEDGVNGIKAVDTSIITIDISSEEIPIVTPPIEGNKKSIRGSVPMNNISNKNNRHGVDRTLSMSDSSNEFINEHQYFNDINNKIFGLVSKPTQTYSKLFTSSSIDIESLSKDTDDSILLETKDDSNDCIIVDAPSSSQPNNAKHSTNEKYVPFSHTTSVQKPSYLKRQTVGIQRSKYFASPIVKSFAKSNLLSPSSQIPHKRPNTYVSPFQSSQRNRIVSQDHKRLKTSSAFNTNGPMDGFRKQQQLWQQYSSRSQQQTANRKNSRQAKTKPPSKASIKSFFRPITEK